MRLMAAPAVFELAHFVAAAHLAAEKRHAIYGARCRVRAGFTVVFGHWLALRRISKLN